MINKADRESESIIINILWLDIIQFIVENTISCVSDYKQHTVSLH